LLEKSIKPINLSNENSKQGSGSVYSKAIRAGRRRTYFFDVRNTKGNDYYITITESKKKFNEEGYERHKIFLYKEDFNKFLEAMNETVNHVKMDLLPEYDFDEFSKNDEFNNEEGGQGYRRNDDFNSTSEIKPKADYDDFNSSSDLTPKSGDDDDLKL